MNRVGPEPALEVAPIVHVAAHRSTAVVISLVLALGACSGGAEDGRYTLPRGEVEQYETAYIAEVVPAGTAEDGEHLVLHNRHEIVRADLGGWAIEDADGNRLRIPFSRQIDPGERLTVRTGRGEDGDDVIHAGLEGDILGDDGDTLVLLDAAGKEVARFSYGD